MRSTEAGITRTYERLFVMSLCFSSEWTKDDGEATFGLLSQVSPDGRYVISTVKDRAVFVATPEIAFSQLFFPIKGILVVYDTVTGTYQPLTVWHEQHVVLGLAEDDPFTVRRELRKEIAHPVM